MTEHAKCGVIRKECAFSPLRFIGFCMIIAAVYTLELAGVRVRFTLLSAFASTEVAARRRTVWDNNC